MELFPLLFEEDEEESGEDPKETKKGFTETWGLFIIVDRVTQFTNHTMTYVLTEMNIIDLLTYYLYLKQKTEFEDNLREQYKRNN